jgi:hypothetical protein
MPRRRRIIAADLADIRRTTFPAPMVTICRLAFRKADRALDRNAFMVATCKPH